MRLWIVGGGTGGHVYPALAVAQALTALCEEVALTWVGTTTGMEREIVQREGIPFIGLPAGGLHGVGILHAIRNGWTLVRGLYVAWRHIRRERPSALFTTGGYVSGPAALAARQEGIPILVFLPDIEPAQSVRAVARLARRVAVSVPDSLQYFPEGKAVVTGYPLGRRITRWTRDEGREALHLSREARVLLIFGGSRGARSINRATLHHVAALTRLAHVVHITGTLDWPEVVQARDALPQEVLARYHAYPYLHERMGAALAAADLAVARAGAGVLGEFPYFGLPGVLVPYPHAWRYQKVNAEWLADRGAALVIEDAALEEQLVPTVVSLFEAPERLAAMRDAARRLARPRAAEDIARLMLELVSEVG